MDNILGGCLCGEIRFKIKQVFDAGYCHCAECRKMTGSAALTWAAVEKPFFEVLSGVPKFYEREEGGGQYFCSNCGSPVYYFLNTNPYLSVSLGCLDEPERVRPKIHQFCSSKLSWFNLSDDLPKILDGALPHPDRRKALHQNEGHERFC